LGGARYEWNAKTQVTFWEYQQPDPNNASAVYRLSTLQDYACKQWSGLLKSYYRPRWEIFLNQTLNQLSGADPAAAFDVGRFYSSMYAWFAAWQSDDKQTFPTKPFGDAVAISQKLYARYGSAPPGNTSPLVLHHGGGAPPPAPHHSNGAI
jgi:alpha-N-acetylglucosaminidase